MPKRGGEDKTRFIVVVNLGVAQWKGQGTEHYYAHSPTVAGRKKKKPDNAWFLLASLCTVSFPLSLSYFYQQTRSHIQKGLALFEIMFLDVIQAKYAVEPLCGSNYIVVC